MNWWVEVTSIPATFSLHEKIYIIRHLHFRQPNPHRQNGSWGPSLKRNIRYGLGTRFIFISWFSSFTGKTRQFFPVWSGDKTPFDTFFYWEILTFGVGTSWLNCQVFACLFWLQEKVRTKSCKKNGWNEIWFNFLNAWIYSCFATNVHYNGHISWIISKFF